MRNKKLKFFRIFLLLFIFIECLIFPLELHSQNLSIINGRIVDVSGSGISGVHIINKNQKIGKTSQLDGYYNIPAMVGDSIIFTHIGYKPIWHSISQDSINLEYFVMIRLISDTVYLAETVVRPFPSSFNEFKEMVSQLKLPEVKTPNSFEKLSGPVYSSHGGIILPGPVSILYALFSKESKQLKKMNEINHFESVRKTLFAKVPKEIMFKNFEINSELELEFFLQSCRLSEEFIQKSSSYEIYKELHSCFIAHKNEEK